MTEDLFAHAWARRDRAWEITERMVQIWNEYLSDHPYYPTLLGRGEGVFVLRINESAPPPQEFAVATGEWINHLRSALDYTIWATAAFVSGRVPPPNEGQIQYPIYDSADTWQRNLPRLKALREHHREMLLTMQPFNSDPDANYLGWINRIARSDRHRQLSRMTGYLAELEPALIAPAGCEVTLQWGERVLVDGYADVARFVVTPYDPDMTVEVNPRMGIDPEVEAWSRSAFWRRIRFPERLRLLHVWVGADIAAYEYDCTGSTRMEDVLTEDYRAACDARPKLSLPKRARPPVEWSEPARSRRATAVELVGEDFPPEGPGPVRERP
jgi:hypothetical protein